MRGFKSSDSKSSSEPLRGESMSSSTISSAPHSPASPSASVSSTPSSISAAPTRSAAPTAIIGPKIRVKGELVGEEDLLIQGQVDGTIDLKNHTLTVGEQGVVKANVLAKTVTIEGTIEGDLFGQERISILASSNVKGNIVAERVTLEDGAKFRGSIDMDIESHKDKFQKMGASSPAVSKVTSQDNSSKSDNK
ncbi:protein CcmA, bactofilin family [Alteromonadaceae bacterium Bs31]|nr:protein CcmA, bactofilin family [Alteromonadaceae bacterium Bs31]